MSKIKTIVCCLYVIMYIGGAFLFLKDAPLLIDERWHYPQIQDFLRGNFHLQEKLTVLPGYHLFMAGVGWTFQQSSIPFMRGLNLGISLLVVLLFMRLLKTIHQTISPYRLLQFLCIPLILPYFFLIYTDLFSLLFILSGLYLGLHRQYFLAGIVCSASIAVRQNNVIWLAMIFLMTHGCQESVHFTRESLVRCFKSCWSFLIGIMALAGYILVNNGVVPGDQSSHPTGKISSGNLFFLLLLYSILFLPHILSSLFQKNLFPSTKRRVIVITLSIAAVLYFATFSNTHPYNQYDYFLRNRVLMLMTSTLSYKILFFLPIVLALCHLIATPLTQKRFLLLYPFTILILLPSWLIEQRYCIVSFSLYLLFTPPENSLVEKITPIYYLALSTYFIYGIGAGLFFL